MSLTLAFVNFYKEKRGKKVVKVSKIENFSPKHHEDFNEHQTYTVMWPHMPLDGSFSTEGPFDAKIICLGVDMKDLEHEAKGKGVKLPANIEMEVPVESVPAVTTSKTSRGRSMKSTKPSTTTQVEKSVPDPRMKRKKKMSTEDLTRDKRHVKALDMYEIELFKPDEKPSTVVEEPDSKERKNSLCQNDAARDSVDQSCDVEKISEEVKENVDPPSLKNLTSEYAKVEMQLKEARQEVAKLKAEIGRNAKVETQLKEARQEVAKLNAEIGRNAKVEMLLEEAHQEVAKLKAENQRYASVNLKLSEKIVSNPSHSFAPSNEQVHDTPDKSSIRPRYKRVRTLNLDDTGDTLPVDEDTTYSLSSPSPNKKSSSERRFSPLKKSSPKMRLSPLKKSSSKVSLSPPERFSPTKRLSTGDMWSASEESESNGRCSPKREKSPDVREEHQVKKKKTKPLEKRQASNTEDYESNDKLGELVYNAMMGKKVLAKDGAGKVHVGNAVYIGATSFADKICKPSVSPSIALRDVMSQIYSEEELASRSLEGGAPVKGSNEVKQKMTPSKREALLGIYRAKVKQTTGKNDKDYLDLVVKKEGRNVMRYKLKDASMKKKKSAAK